MKRALLFLISFTLLICGAGSLYGCKSDNEDCFQYKQLADETYSIALKDEYTEKFTFEVEQIYPYYFAKNSVKRGKKYDKVPADIEIPNTYNNKPITKIEDLGFANENIKSIIIPDGIKTIGMSAFFGATFDTVAIPDSVSVIGEYAFATNSSLKNATLGSSVTRLHTGTFYGCNNLKKLIMPKNITVIDDYVFYADKTLISPDKTYALNTIYYEGNNSEWKNVSMPWNLERNAEVCFYEKNGDVSKYIDGSHSYDKIWNYDENGEVKVTDIEYTETIKGKTYTFSHCTVEITDIGWSELLEMGEYELNGTLSGEEIKIFRNSRSKEDFAKKIEEYNNGKYADITLEFAEGKYIIRENGKELHSFNYEEANGTVFLWNNEKFDAAFSLENNMVTDETVYSKTDYSYKKCYFVESN